MASKTLSPLTLLVPLDGSELAEQALPYARMLATLAPTRVHLLHVIAPSVVDRRARHEEAFLGAAGDTLGTHSDQMAQMREQMQEDAERYLDLQAAKIDVVQCVIKQDVVFGSVAEQISAAADRFQASMIVMATHGAGG
ncbi:MAG: universal stress protein [Oscillochloris sp.]|nr:universal stress protein [Oscillochloris sp.]